MTESDPSTCLINVSTEKSPNTFAIIDKEDFPLVSKYEWYADRDKYVRRRSKNKMFLHRLILSAKDGEYVDHANHNPLDNRRCNIRICTNQENQQNSKPNSGRRYKGVYHHTKGDWEAAIGINGRRAYLGLYSDPIHAAMAYDIISNLAFGEFSHPNLKDHKVPTYRELVLFWLKHNQLPKSNEVTIMSQARLKVVSNQELGKYDDGFQDRVKKHKYLNNKDGNGQKKRKRDTQGHNTVTENTKRLMMLHGDKLAKSPLSDYYWANRLGLDVWVIAEIRDRMCKKRETRTRI